MNKSILFLFLIISNYALSYTPTSESLFRNGSNQDIGNSTVVGALKIEKMVAEDIELNNQPTKSAVKILIGNEDPQRRKFIQIDYKDGVVSDLTMNKINYRKNFSLKSLNLLQTNQAEAAIFYSLINTLLTNNSDLFVELIKSVETNAQTNKDLIYSEQDSLLRQYKSYISKSASVEADVEMKSPLYGETPEDRERIKEILNAPYLKKDAKIMRTKEGDNFYWDFVGDKFYARFDGESHKLKKLTLTLPEGKVEVDCYNYILFNASMEFPEVIYFKDLAGQMYEIKMSKIYVIKEKPGTFSRRLKKYEKTLNNNEEKNTDIIKPLFLI